MVLLVRVLTLSVALAASAVFAAGCNGVSVSGAGDDRMPDAAPTVTSPGASDTGAAPDTVAAGDMVAPTPALSYQGSPLCNASRSTGCCYPDDPTNAQACAQAACQSAPDAGPSEASGAYIDVALGCHVVPAPSLDASPGSASTSPACLPGGGGLDGFPCAGPADCSPSYECVGTVGTTPTCRHYCCNGDDSCHDLQFCDIQPTFAWPETKVPACMPVEPCTLLEVLQCHAGETCAVVRDDGTTSCVAIGHANAGQSCETDHCASGLVCLGTPGTRTCYVLCNTGASSAKSKCSLDQKCQGGLPLFPNPDFGICQ